MVAAAPAQPAGALRGAIRDLLTASAGFHALDPVARREVAQSLVRISHTALALAAQTGGTAPASPLAAAQSAGASFSGVATDRLASTTQRVLNAVSFPRFVNELITGVFKALNESNQQQLQAFLDLVRNVSASAEGFADAQLGEAGARAWLAEHFPANFIVQGDEDDATPDEIAAMSPEERAERQVERDASTRLVLRPGASMPSEGALRAVLGLRAEDMMPTGGPEALVGFAHAAMARNRQQLLSTMVMMGLQRIVVESGRLNASMRFHIDTRSAAADDRGSQFDLRNEVEAGGSFGYGPWGVNARIKNTIGYVSTQRTQTTEEMNTDLDLNSSVELLFRTDYVPLTRLAQVEEIERIRVNTLNPAEEMRLGEESRRARREAGPQAEEARRASLDARLAQPRAEPARSPAPSSATAPAGTTP
ncbi:MAG: hypothetical protein AB7O44_29375 [Hyphomicrobiaceae bacterium]